MILRLLQPSPAYTTPHCWVHLWVLQPETHWPIRNLSTHEFHRVLYYQYQKEIVKSCFTSNITKEEMGHCEIWVEMTDLPQRGLKISENKIWVPVTDWSSSSRIHPPWKTQPWNATSLPDSLTWEHKDISNPSLTHVGSFTLIPRQDVPSWMGLVPALITKSTACSEFAVEVCVVETAM